MAEKLKAVVTADQVRSLVQSLFDVQVDRLVELNGYDDLNFLCSSAEPTAMSKSVCKITNHVNTAEPDVLGGSAVEQSA